MTAISIISTLSRSDFEVGRGSEALARLILHNYFKQQKNYSLKIQILNQFGDFLIQFV